MSGWVSFLSMICIHCYDMYASARPNKTALKGKYFHVQCQLAFLFMLMIHSCNTCIWNNNTIIMKLYFPLGSCISKLSFTPLSLSVHKNFKSVLCMHEQIQSISGYKRSKQQLNEVIDGTEGDNSIVSDKEDITRQKLDSTHSHSEHYEFGQRIVPSSIKTEVPFSIKKKNSYLDIFKKCKFSLNLEHKASLLYCSYLILH